MRLLVIAGLMGFIILEVAMSANNETQKARPVSVMAAKPRRLWDLPGGFPGVKKLSDGAIFVAASTAGHHRISGKMLETFYSHLKRGGGLSERELAQAGVADDINLGRGYWAVQSRDGGATWAEVTNDAMRIFSGSSCGGLVELKDGTLLGNYVFSIYTDQKQELILWRSQDKGKTWSPAEFAQMTGPMQKDPAWGDGRMGGCFYSRMQELPDGSILLFGHAVFAGDRKCRVVAYRSADRGRSFQYYATVAFIDNDSTPLAAGGVNEPEAVQLPGGEMLCFMRTAEYEPLLLARSPDGGRNWSPPEKVGVDGIRPTPVLLQNGVLALSYGRPGVWVVFSTDGGRWWTNKTCIYIWHSLWGEGHLPKTKHYLVPGYHTFERSDCNARICEIAPNRLLVVYSAPKTMENKPIDAQDALSRSSCFVWGVTLDIGLK